MQCPVNTIAASADGRAVYIDNSNVGALSEEAILNWHNTLKAVLSRISIFREDSSS